MCCPSYALYYADAAKVSMLPLCSANRAYILDIGRCVRRSGGVVLLISPLFPCVRFFHFVECGIVSFNFDERGVQFLHFVECGVRFLHFVECGVRCEEV